MGEGESRRNGGLSTAGKALRLAALAPVRPVQFYDRIRALLEIAINARRRGTTPHVYTAEPWEPFATRAAALLESPVAWSEDEPGFADTRERMARRMREIGPSAVPAAHDGDPLLARLAYFLTLALRPSIVLETGVALGVTSSYVLAALDRVGGEGRLVSIDRPPLGVGADGVGQLIPPELRGHWTLHVGTSTRVLPRVAPALPPIGLFIQDSLFTERNVRGEFQHVLPRLAPRCAIVANAADQTRAFASLVQLTKPALSATLRAQGKDEMIGVSLYPAATPALAARETLSALTKS